MEVTDMLTPPFFSIGVNRGDPEREPTTQEPPHNTPYNYNSFDNGIVRRVPFDSFDGAGVPLSLPLLLGGGRYGR